MPGHRLEAVIGSGGSSVVWSGRDATGRPVAIKVPHVCLDPVTLEQATTERHVLMAVEHDHLVGLRDVVPLPDGRIALVFDLVIGAPLSSLVGRRGHLRPGEVVTVLTPLCHAVSALHSAGGVHGDISAGNVMICETGVPKLLDLGAARVVATAPGAVHGTTGFVAPEVGRGSLPDARSDVFSLGALAWFCATGNGAPDTDQRLDPEIVSSHVGAELASVVAACIDPDPTRRPEVSALARLFYDTSPAEPIEVVVGGDDAAALTHRLRWQAAGEPANRGAVPSRWKRMLRLPRPSAPNAVRPAAGARSPAGEPPADRGLSPVGAASRRALSLRLLLALAAGLVVVGAAAVVKSVSAGMATAASPAPIATDAPLIETSPTKREEHPASSTTSTTSTARATPTIGPTTAAVAASATPRPQAGDPASSTDVRTDRRAPAKHTEALVTALSTTRAEALSRRDRAGLAQVHRLQSPSWVADEKLIDALSAEHLRWQSLRPSVDSARLITSAGDHAVVRATVRWASYEVVSSDGAKERRPADPGNTLDFQMVWLPQGWRIESLSRPPLSASPAS